MKNKTFITYGEGSCFDPEKFEKVRNRPMFENISKPTGGLWSSPVDSVYGWKDFCLSEDFCVKKLNIFFEFKIKEDSKILVIDSLNDFKRCVNEGYTRDKLDYIAKHYPNDELIQRCYSNFRDRYYLDFEKLVSVGGYQAILLTNRGEQLTRYETSLYGWDVETLLVLDKDIVIP